MKSDYIFAILTSLELFNRTEPAGLRAWYKYGEECLYLSPEKLEEFHINGQVFSICFKAPVQDACGIIDNMVNNKKDLYIYFMTCYINGLLDSLG